MIFFFFLLLYTSKHINRKNRSLNGNLKTPKNKKKSGLRVWLKSITNTPKGRIKQSMNISITSTGTQKLEESHNLKIQWTLKIIEIPKLIVSKNSFINSKKKIRLLKIPRTKNLSFSYILISSFIFIVSNVKTKNVFFVSVQRTVYQFSVVDQPDEVI